MSLYRIANENYLEHHGIKGQKWGIRRYQNEDGSLTPEGRERYGLGKDTNDYSRYNLKKRTKMLQKETSRRYRLLSNNLDVAQDLASQREYDDRKKWSSNKSFKEDMKKEALKYAKLEEQGADFNEMSDQEDKTIADLSKKYPGAKDLLEGLSFHEHISNARDVEDAFNSPSMEFSNGENPIYSSWLDNVLNNDFYYEPNDEDFKTADTLSAVARAEWNNELANKYGQDAVNEILKKGYSSLV